MSCLKVKAVHYTDDRLLVEQMASEGRGQAVGLREIGERCLIRGTLRTGAIAAARLRH